jgi:hypothetical protein
MLAGNLASIGVGGLVALGVSLWRPEAYDFVPTRAMNAPAGSRFAPPTAADEDEKSPTYESKDEKAASSEAREARADAPAAPPPPDESDLEPAALERAFRFAAWASVILVRGPVTLRWPARAVVMTPHALRSSWCCCSRSRSRCSLRGPCSACAASRRGPRSGSSGRSSASAPSSSGR